MRLPRSIQQLVEAFEKLPGIGPKTAQRLTFYLLHVPQSELDSFAEAIGDLKRKTKVCSICFNVDEIDPCLVCQDDKRDRSMICVVEEPFDVLALEKTGKYWGVYHVLGGAIRPLDNIGPDELRIAEFLKRAKNDDKIKEIILATNPDTEGEATAMYIANKVRELKTQSANPPACPSDRRAGGRTKLKTLRITRLGRGVPTGGSLEFTDDQTLGHALEGRKEY